jgi:ABC-type transport system involved in multi-copper enzyme maturation permease subunit
MRDLIRAELLKLRTTRSFWWLVASSLVFVPVSVGLAVHGAGGADAAPLDSTEGVRNVMAAASSGGLLLLILGITAMTAEFRHGTIASTFLVTPDRARVVGAKLAAVSLVGGVLALAAAGVTLAVGLPWLAADGVHPAAYGGDIAVTLLGALIATALYAVVGVGVGALVPRQSAAVAGALVWVLVVESVLVGFAPELGRWLPGGAAAALTGVATPKGGLLPMWAGGLLLCAYGLAFAAAGARTAMRRDIA